MAKLSPTLQLHGRQHTRLPCPSLSPRIWSDSYPFSQWCHPTSSSSAVPFCSCPQSVPASGSFSVNHLVASGGGSASASVLPVNIQGWFPLGLTGLILLSKGLSWVFTTGIQKHQFFGAQPSLWSNSHICIQLQKKTIALTIRAFVGKVMLLLFNMLSRFVIAFLSRNKCLLILWLQSASTVILELKKIKSASFPTYVPSICPEVMGPDAMIFVFWMLSFKPAFSWSSFTLIKRLFLNLVSII